MKESTARSTTVTGPPAATSAPAATSPAAATVAATRTVPARRGSRSRRSTRCRTIIAAAATSRKHDEPPGEVTALGLCRLQRRARRGERMRPRGLEHAERGRHAADERRNEEPGTTRVESRLHERTAGQRDSAPRLNEK